MANAAPQIDKAGHERVCPHCKESILSDDGYCPECGAPLPEAAGPANSPPAAAPAGAIAEIKCIGCGQDVGMDQEYCPDCGAPASARRVEPMAVAVPVPAPQEEKQPVQGRACPSCGRPARPGTKFCGACGFRLDVLRTQDKQDKQEEAEDESVQQLRPGQVLAQRYEVKRKIGGGGMGTVYEALDTHLTSRQNPDGNPVAIKAILDTSDPDLLAAAAEECKMLIEINHTNVVRILDIVRKRDVPYIVMERLQGATWEQIYEKNRGPLPESQVLRMLIDVVKAFQYLHARTPPVVHCDFKPSNVIEIVEPNGVSRQVLIDMGTAIEYVPGQKRDTWGTFGYIPPEISGVCEHPPSRDLYAIASAGIALLGVDLSRYPVGVPPREEWRISPEAYNFFKKARHTNRRQRFQSADEMFNQLDGIYRFIEGDERAGLKGGVYRRSGSTQARSLAEVPVRSNIITGKLSASGKITALPIPHKDDPARQKLHDIHELIKRGESDDALRQLKIVLKKHPTSIEAHLLKVAVLHNNGQTAEAQTILEHAILHSPEACWGRLLVQAQASIHDNPVEAEKCWVDLISQLPGEVLPKQGLAQVLRNARRYEEAADLYARIVAADPANANAMLGLADCLRELDYIDRAVSVLDDVNENSLRYVDAKLRLVSLYLIRVERFLSRHSAAPPPNNVGKNDEQALRADMETAAREIRGLKGRTEVPAYFRLRGDWWYAAYRLSSVGLLPSDMSWPDEGSSYSNDSKGVAGMARQAYREYLQRAPTATDRKEVLARIYFHIKEPQRNWRHRLKSR